MTTVTPQQARNRVAALSKHHPGSPELADARRELAEANIAAAVARFTADAPALTNDQRARLAGLILGGAA